MINLLRELPKKINSKPSITTNYKGERFAIIDFIMYKIVNERIKINDLLKIWANTIKKDKPRRIEKNIVIKRENKINNLKIIKDHILQCDCEEFERLNDCIHISKLKKYFKM